MLKLIAEEENRINYKALEETVFKKLNQKDDLSIEIIFLSKEEIRSLNNETRNVDKVTDVLSFPSLDNIRNKVIRREDFPFDVDEDTNSIFLGSIAICIKKAEEQAIEYGHSVERELNYLTLHGILHLFGYDHMEKEDEEEMTTLANSIMQEINIIR